MKTRFLALALALAACGPHRTGHTTAAHQRDVITADEIAAIDATTAYDVVKRLRPQFLSGRGPVSLRNPTDPTPIVYLDGVRYGDVSTLAAIDAARIATIRHYTGPEAQVKFGTDHAGGAIVITSKQ